MSSALRRIHFVGCPRIGAPVFLWEFCSKVTTEWLFYKCSEWSVAAREMHLSGCWKAAICHRCHLSQMCSAAREEFPHFLEGLQGAMMAAWEVCLHSEGALFSTMVWIWVSSEFSGFVSLYSAEASQRAISCWLLGATFHQSWFTWKCMIVFPTKCGAVPYLSKETQLWVGDLLAPSLWDTLLSHLREVETMKWIKGSGIVIWVLRWSGLFSFLGQ